METNLCERSPAPMHDIRQTVGKRRINRAGWQIRLQVQVEQNRWESAVAQLASNVAGGQDRRNRYGMRERALSLSAQSNGAS